MTQRLEELAKRCLRNRQLSTKKMTLHAIGPGGRQAARGQAGARYYCWAKAGFPTSCPVRSIDRVRTPYVEGGAIVGVVDVLTVAGVSGTWLRISSARIAVVAPEFRRLVPAFGFCGTVEMQSDFGAPTPNCWIYDLSHLILATKAEKKLFRDGPRLDI